jgi:ketosteroid isomerase-like protein
LYCPNHQRVPIRVRAVSEELDAALERYHAAGHSFVNGDPEPQKAVFSHSSDACLVNPMGVIASGWAAVGATMDEAAARFSGGDMAFEPIHRVELGDVAYVTEIESWRARLVETGEEAAGALRVTSILRRESDGWRVVHRHADPIPRRAAPDKSL